MSGHVLRLLKGTRHAATCGRCQQSITWAICAPRGRHVPLIAAPIVLREERNDRDVVFEIVGGDQVHQCPARPKPAKATVPAPVRAARHIRRQGVFSAFSSDKLHDLRAAIDQGPKPPSPQRDLFDGQESPR